jgi:hypothetical protein
MHEFKIGKHEISSLGHLMSAFVHTFDKMHKSSISQIFTLQGLATLHVFVEQVSSVPGQALKKHIFDVQTLLLSHLLSSHIFF